MIPPQLSWLQTGGLFLPEMTLTAVLLGLLAADLFFKQVDRTKLMNGAILGAAFVAVALVLIWPISGSAFHGSFLVDPLATCLKSIILTAGVLALLMARESRETLGARLVEFSILTLLAVLGAFFLASSGDLITLFISFEWLTISLYILTAYLKSDRYSLESGTKYLIMGVFSSAILLYGISFIYGATGSFHLAHSSGPWQEANGPFLQMGFLLLVAGVGFKIAAFPFQLWVPDVYQGAPTPVTAFLSVGSKAAGFAALFKILSLLGSPRQVEWQTLASLLAASTLLYGNLGAIGQSNMKRLFAYSGIGQAGYLLIGIACASHPGFEATLFYLAAYGIANLTAFLVITIVNHKRGGGEQVDYRGLAHDAPWLAASFFVALLSLAGIPPLVGFFGKFLVLKSAIDHGLLWLAILGALNIPISLYYYLGVIREMYFASSVKGEVILIAPLVKFFLTLLVLAMIGLGVFQAPLVQLASTSAQALTQ